MMTTAVVLPRSALWRGTREVEGRTVEPTTAKKTLSWMQQVCLWRHILRCMHKVLRFGQPLQSHKLTQVHSPHLCDSWRQLCHPFQERPGAEVIGTHE